eukprot:TRINITY_DN305_c0_g1_i5.p1 TRINITY_DN305_c0_g1~~TRINITY_DN305_c0_g1_i5.p1  ORF type:complete len:651 (-),score=195.49 TRINITY_DN305_c0_g1_i5:185-2137(-)
MEKSSPVPPPVVVPRLSLSDRMDQQPSPTAPVSMPLMHKKFHEKAFRLFRADSPSLESDGGYSSDSRSRSGSFVEATPPFLPRRDSSGGGRPRSRSIRFMEDDTLSTGSQSPVIPKMPILEEMERFQLSSGVDSPRPSIPPLIRGSSGLFKLKRGEGVNYLSPIAHATTTTTTTKTSPTMPKIVSPKPLAERGEKTGVPMGKVSSLSPSVSPLGRQDGRAGGAGASSVMSGPRPPPSVPFSRQSSRSGRSIFRQFSFKKVARVGVDVKRRHTQKAIEEGEKRIEWHKRHNFGSEFLDAHRKLRGRRVKHAFSPYQDSNKVIRERLRHAQRQMMAGIDGLDPIDAILMAGVEDEATLYDGSLYSPSYVDPYDPIAWKSAGESEERSSSDEGRERRIHTSGSDRSGDVRGEVSRGGSVSARVQTAPGLARTRSGSLTTRSIQTMPSARSARSFASSAEDKTLRAILGDDIGGVGASDDGGDEEDKESSIDEEEERRLEEEEEERAFLMGEDYFNAHKYMKELRTEAKAYRRRHERVIATQRPPRLAFGSSNFEPFAPPKAKLKKGEVDHRKTNISKVTGMTRDLLLETYRQHTVHEEIRQLNAMMKKESIAQDRASRIQRKIQSKESRRQRVAKEKKALLQKAREKRGGWII